MKRDLIASLIFAAGCFVFFWLVVPQYDIILDIRAAISGQKSLLEERMTLRENVSKLASQYSAKRNDIDKLSLLLPKNEGYDQIIETIRAATVQNGLQMSSIQAGKETKTTTDPYTRTFVSVEINGGYDSLFNFLKDIENNLRLCDVTEISLSPDGSSGTGSFTISIDLTTYSLKTK